MLFSLTFIILLFFVSPLPIHNLKYFHKIDGTDIYTLSKGKITTRTTPVLNDRRGPIPHGVFLYAIEGNTEVVTDYDYWTNYPPNTESVPYSISVYDVSSYIETFPDKESYKHLLENFDKRLQGYYDFDLMLRKNPVWHKWYGSFYKFRYTGATSYFFYDAKTKEHGTRTVFLQKESVHIRSQGSRIHLRLSHRQYNQPNDHIAFERLYHKDFIGYTVVFYTDNIMFWKHTRLLQKEI